MRACNLAGRVGICSYTAAPAPAASRTAIWFALAMLVLIGGRSMRRIRRDS